MTGEPEMIQLERDHGGVEVQERSCTSFQLEDLYSPRNDPDPEMIPKLTPK